MRNAACPADRFNVLAPLTTRNCLDFTSLAFALCLRDLHRMETIVDRYEGADSASSTISYSRRVLPVDWAEPKSFHVRLKRARHQAGESASPPMHLAVNPLCQEAA